MGQKKRIVVCCDGTWNEPDKHPTNVVKIAHHLKPETTDGVQQVVFYDQGVGTQGSLDRYIGGATGRGIEKNVLDAYRFIVHNYDGQSDNGHDYDDEIYLFGFSRGAYTARAVAGMIHTVGLLKKDLWQQLPAAYQYYRTPPQQRPADSPFKRPLTKQPRIKMVGVWDTVGALGVPTPGLKTISKNWVGFFDTELSPLVEHAYHALALDEKRGPFAPSIWQGSPQNGQKVEQCWFAGVHSDIGGGYEDDAGVSDISLVWMVEKATALGLEFDTEDETWQESVKPDSLAPLHDSYGVSYKLFGKLVGSPSPRKINTNSPGTYSTTIHPSVLHRMQNSSYMPEIIKAINQQENDPENQHSDRRRTNRVLTFDTPVQLVVEQQVHDGVLRSFSPGGGIGINIKSNVQLKVDDCVDVVLGRQKVNARCVWTADEQRYGLRF
ncbi:MAG: DUF2235 domain-containing protein [Gammaproteobacteria bacterium]|nr:DUF2235 domain-containing protein [Gammaproteobacteria bacterium]